MQERKLCSDYELRKIASYLALTGELWGLFYEFFVEKIPWDIVIASHIHICILPHYSTVKYHSLLKYFLVEDKEVPVYCTAEDLGPILLRWINFNTSMDK